MHGKNYDFAGYVTKNDILCSDGVTIKQNAFMQSHGAKVPLVWNHDYNSPNNVLGHVILQQTDLGTYGYGYFNDTEEAQNAKEMVRHGDIASMSIGARKIQRQGSNVIHGEIYEVSLVLAGANPGATIDTVMSHSADGDTEKGLIYTAQLIHSADDIPEEDPIMEDQDMHENDAELVDILDAMSDEEFDEFVNELDEDELQALADVYGDDEDENEDQALADDEGYDGYDEDEDYDYEEDEEDDSVKHNIFDGLEDQGEILTHADQAVILDGAITGKVDSFKDYLLQAGYDEATQKAGTDYGIENIDYLFPEVHELDRTPKFLMDQNTAFREIIDGVTKVPFSKIKTRYFDIDVEDEKQRAKGYVKGTRKVDEVIKVLKRETYPTTIYKKQKLDRDDIIEITDFDVVSQLNAEMRILLEMELARCILIGDGRETSSEFKIDEEKIRPIVSDDEVYAIKGDYDSAEKFVESVIKIMPEYQGTGGPKMFIDPILLADVKLLKGTDGRWLNGHIATNQELAMQMGVSKIVETSFLKGKGTAIIVNLADYAVGSTRGGQLTSFNDFDIDFNKYKYLIETRLSGALRAPKSAIVLNKKGAAGPEGDEAAAG